MNKLHEQLMDKSSLYANWHQRRHHHTLQWIIVIIVGVVFAFIIVHRLQEPHPVSYGLQGQAKVGDQQTPNQAAVLHAQIPEQTRELLDAILVLKKAPAELRSSLTEQIVELARARQNSLLELMSLDARGVLNHTINPGLRSQMPEAVQQLVEENVTIDGTLEWLISDNLKDKTHKEDFTLTDRSNKKYKLNLSESPKAITGSKVRVKGVLLDQDLVVDTLTQTATPSSATTSTASVTKKVAVIMVNFQNNSIQPYTAEMARNEVFNDGRVFYENGSFGQWTQEGKVSPTGDVYGWYTIPHSLGSSCDTILWASAADTAAAAAGVDLSGYDNKIYGLIDISYSVCNFTGRAELGGSRVWINGAFGMDSVITTHELGHNYAMNHANSYTCHDGSPTGPIVSISNFCTSNEYGDPFDTMGGGSGDFNNYHKGTSAGPTSTHWLSPANTLTLDPVANPSGTYTLAPVEISSSGVQALRIPLQPLGYYYLEFRQPLGNDVIYGTTAPVVNGVSIRIAPDYTSINTSKLIDSTPGTGTFNDSALAAGQTFSDPGNGISVTTLSVSPSGAQVQVTLTQSACTRANPTISISPTSQIGAPGQTLSYNLTVTNNDSVECSSQAFNVSQIAFPGGWSQSPNSYTTPVLAPGATNTTVVNITSSTTAGPQNYSFTERVGSTLNSAYSSTADGTYTVTQAGDSTPPVVKITKPAPNYVIPSKGNTSVGATASDNSGKVSLLAIYLDDKVLKTCTGKQSTSCSAGFNNASVTPGLHTIKAWASDLAGNVNFVTITATK